MATFFRAKIEIGKLNFTDKKLILNIEHKKGYKQVFVITIFGLKILNSSLEKREKVCFFNSNVSAIGCINF